MTIRQALITSSVGVYTCSCGGKAYVGAFDNVGDTYKPALIFYDMLGPGSEKYIVEAVSHEVCLTLSCLASGLRLRAHQGNCLR